jgi:hypothetical protein
MEGFKGLLPVDMLILDIVGEDDGAPGRDFVLAVMATFRMVASRSAPTRGLGSPAW